MAVRTAEKSSDRARTPEGVAAQEEVVVKAPRGLVGATAEELGAEKSGMQVDVPADILENVQTYMDNYKAFLLERTEAQMEQLAARRQFAAGPEIGGITVGTYPYMDLFVISPIEIFGPPFSWRPNKVVGSGELAVILVVMFVNPAVAPGPAPPAVIQLGGRGFRVRIEQINLTDVTNGPDVTFVGTFPPVAPTISIFPFFFIAPNPGPNPRLMECNAVADITDVAQPHAAFATHHLDIDAEPPFLGIPGVPPELQHDIPLRYLIFPK